MASTNMSIPVDIYIDQPIVAADAGYSEFVTHRKERVMLPRIPRDITAQGVGAMLSTAARSTLPAGAVLFTASFHVSAEPKSMSSSSELVAQYINFGCSGVYLTDAVGAVSDAAKVSRDTKLISAFYYTK
jgi:hypothetical protein